MIDNSKLSNQEDVKDLKKSEELEKVNIARSFHDKDLNQDTEAQPLNSKHTFEHQTTREIIAISNEEKKFENTIQVQLIYSQIQLIQKMRLTTSICLIFLTLTIYEYWDPYTDDYLSSKMFANVVTTILSLIAVAGYLL